MTDKNPITIDAVRNWNLSAGHRLAIELGSLANTIETDVEVANREVQQSRDYFDSEAGEAMRARYDADRRNALATVDALQAMTTPISEVATLFDNE
ncbi:hypothetical protein [Nocardia farcinica]|uniref:hypothetical protein n=1 Tax=Nocardia farcinica TaxID=37329 RepID=UPI001894CBEE|nr:hypothetical protein [Nocardia farcinica]MBF6070833.1 hypothetical protein [Nocardia farcinica]